jgi:hypothetical protein
VGADHSRQHKEGNRQASDYDPEHAHAPLIDTNNGGSGVEFPQTLARAVTEITNVDTVITGHSPVMKWHDFIEYAEFNRAFLETTRLALKAGKTIDQAAAELTLPDKFRNYNLTRSKENITKIFEELKKE